MHLALFIHWGYVSEQNKKIIFFREMKIIYTWQYTEILKKTKEYKEKIRNFYTFIFREIFSDYGFNV